MQASIAAPPAAPARVTLFPHPQKGLDRHALV